MRKFVTFSIFFVAASVWVSCVPDIPDAGRETQEVNEPLPHGSSAKIDSEQLSSDTLSADIRASEVETDTLSADSLFANAEVSDSVIVDGTEEEPIDSLLLYQVEPPEEFEEAFPDEYSEDARHQTESISKERLISSVVKKVITPDYASVRDSVLDMVEERMSLRSDSPVKKVIVEKWVSPVNYKGYRFNRKKLMLYGVKEKSTVEIYFYLESYYFSVNSEMYDLEETIQSLPFRPVGDSLLINHLVIYADSL